jgi:hypothetical protein
VLAGWDAAAVVSAAPLLDSIASPAAGWRRTAHRLGLAHPLCLLPVAPPRPGRNSGSRAVQAGAVNTARDLGFPS